MYMHICKKFLSLPKVVTIIYYAITVIKVLSSYKFCFMAIKILLVCIYCWRAKQWIRSFV